MAHPMMGMLVKNYGMSGPGAMYGKPQMGDIFGDLLQNLQKSVSGGLQKAENDAIAKTFQTIAKDPVVQQAVVSSGNDAAISSLAAQLKALQTNTYQTVSANPKTTMLVAAGIGLLVIGGIYLAVKK